MKRFCEGLLAADNHLVCIAYGFVIAAKDGTVHVSTGLSV